MPSSFRAMMLACALSGCVAKLEQPPLPEPLTDPGAGVFAYTEGHGLCSAVGIDGHVALTAAHCIHGGTGWLQHFDTAYHVAGVEVDNDRDLATLELADLLPGWLRIASEDVRPGDLLQVWGYGCHDSPSSAPEIRVGVALSPSSARADVCHGDSGGAVIGRDGLAGIARAAIGSRMEFTPL